jgi:hypothetical protein
VDGFLLSSGLGTGLEGGWILKRDGFYWLSLCVSVVALIAYAIESQSEWSVISDNPSVNASVGWSPVAITIWYGVSSGSFVADGLTAFYNSSFVILLVVAAISLIAVRRRLLELGLISIPLLFAYVGASESEWNYVSTIPSSSDASFYPLYAHWTPLNIQVGWAGHETMYILNLSFIIVLATIAVNSVILLVSFVISRRRERSPQ